MNQTDRKELSFEDFCDTYDDHVQWRDWTSLDYLCEEYPHHVERLRSQPWTNDVEDEQ